MTKSLEKVMSRLMIKNLEKLKKVEKHKENQRARRTRSNQKRMSYDLKGKNSRHPVIKSRL